MQPLRLGVDAAILFADILLPLEPMGAPFEFAKGEGPVIHFGTGTHSLLELQRDAGGHVLGLDWRTPLAEGWKRVGHDRAIQGNLDPTVLFAPIDVAKKHAQRVLDAAEGRAGHIFNLGHGILPETPVDTVKAVIDYVHEASAKKP